jgi:hypothetical protein
LLKSDTSVGGRIGSDRYVRISKGLLLDLCGDCRAEINLLVQAQEARVLEMLLKSGAQMPLTMVMG